MNEKFKIYFFFFSNRLVVSNIGLTCTSLDEKKYIKILYLESNIFQQNKIL